jgi:hypothetical protein
MPFLRSALIASGLAAIGQATAGTESVRRSCDHIRSYTTTQGRVLIAKCYQTGNGCGANRCYKENVRLVIPREGCGDIANSEGRLVCLYPGYHASTLARLGGTWRASCRDGALSTRVGLLYCLRHGLRRCGQWELDQRGYLSETATEKHRRPASLRMRRRCANGDPSPTARRVDIGPARPSAEESA